MNYFPVLMTAKQLKKALEVESIEHPDYELLRKELRKRELRNVNRKARNEAMKSLGLAKVRGNQGGTYWE